jgi:hypothetical protein
MNAQRHALVASTLAILLPLVASAADHRDSPISTNDPTADINDIYAFMNPTNPNEVVLIDTVVPFATYNSRFSDAVQYRYILDNGAPGGEITITCTFTQQGTRINCTGPGGLAATGGIERIVQGTGMRVWAGLRDDPFFFDSPAFNATRAALAPRFTNPGTNFFSGNTLAIVIGLERSRINNGGANPVVRFWAASNRIGDNGISSGFTGLWYDPANGGFGAHLEVLDPATPGGPLRLVTTWYVYNANGQQRWIIGDGTINGNTATMTNALYTSGGGFPPNFNSGMVTLRPFGTLTFTFTSCNSGSMNYTTSDPDFGSTNGTVNLTRLTQIRDLPCSLLGTGQIDRMGRPGINTVLVNVLPNTGTALKDAYNRASDRSTWAAMFQTEIQNNLTALDTLDGMPGNALLPAATLAGVLVDDRLVIDTSRATCTAYLAVELQLPNDCGGRTLQRDVIDDSLGAIVGPGVSDNVPLDSVFIADFPFMGNPL